MLYVLLVLHSQSLPHTGKRVWSIVGIVFVQKTSRSVVGDRRFVRRRLCNTYVMKGITCMRSRLCSEYRFLIYWFTTQPEEQVFSKGINTEFVETQTDGTAISDVINGKVQLVFLSRESVILCIEACSCVLPTKKNSWHSL